MTEREDKVRAASLNQLYDLTHDAVHTRCLGALGNPHDAEDAVQEVFRRAAERGLEREWTAAWVHRVASNICVDELRRRQRERRAVWRERRESASATADLVDLVTETSSLAKLLDRLTAAERTVVEMRWRRGLSVTEVAADLGIAGSTARNLLLRARRKISQTRSADLAGL